MCVCVCMREECACEGRVCVKGMCVKKGVGAEGWRRVIGGEVWGNKG